MSKLELYNKALDNQLFLLVGIKSKIEYILEKPNMSLNERLQINMLLQEMMKQAYKHNLEAIDLKKEIDMKLI